MRLLKLILVFILGCMFGGLVGVSTLALFQVASARD